MISNITTKELAEQIKGNLEANLSQSVPFFLRAAFPVLAKVLAAAVVILYKYAGWQFDQLFVSTASYEETTIGGKTLRPLVERGRERGAGDPKYATQAELVLDVSVTNQSGSLARNTLYLREPTGFIYSVKDPVALDSATVQPTVVASSDQDGGDGSGAAGNLQVGDELILVTPNGNVSAKATVASVSIAAADDEDPEVYRERVDQISKRPPQGGAYADYRKWATDVPGINHAYPYSGNYPNLMDVYVEATPASSGSADGIPLQTQLDEAADYIENTIAGRANRRPAGASVTVHPITRRSYNIEVIGLNVADPPTVKTQIATAVDEWLRDREPYIGGLSTTRKDRITRDAVGGVVHSVVEAAGGTVTSVNLLDGVSPIVSDTLDRGEKCKLGADTYP